MQQSFWALGAALFFSVMAAFVKLCSDQLGSLEIVFYRSLIGVISISFYVYSHHLSLKTDHFVGHLRRSILGTLSICLWFYTLGKMNFGTNMTLTYTTPLFMAANFVILAKMRHKPAPWLMVLSILVGFAGVTTVLQPSLDSDQLIPALVCLLVAFIDLITYWQMKELGRLQEPSWRIVFYFTCFGTVTGLLGSYIFEDGMHIPDMTSLIGIVGMGICATLGQLCTTKSYAYGNMLLSSALGFSAIPISALISYFVFGEATTAIGLVGMSLIIGAGIGASFTTKRMEAKEKEEAKAQAKTATTA